MSVRDCSYTPLSPLAPRIADALRNAGEDGLTLREIEVQAGTRWAASAGTLGQASDAPTSPGRLFELPRESHYTAEAA